MMISSIGGDVDDVGSQAATALVSPNEFGWFARYDIGGIKTPNSAGFYDFGVMNHNNVQAFIIDGTGSPTASQILSGETTTFTLAVTGSG